MQTLFEQKMRFESDEITQIINDLYKLEIYETPDGRPIEDVSLFTLKHVHANEIARSEE
ncbi:hypothetical protein [Aquibacillus rhizosphaerae]|uniref:Uncharacterized protein n=1 Tax=Aquibacillus rhizosphaerae TaxID=3051431 RepID=A0ABT7LAD5_9BACI|nr:hypothetical protein [Aquibacillus sp. LR5S19]MDL4842813.1 hypothetical protein [Aquibacillus sp. LR5S19]